MRVVPEKDVPAKRWPQRHEEAAGELELGCAQRFFEDY
jgi:hypothetical protein